MARTSAFDEGSGPVLKRHGYGQNADMNVTPFIDVMLVLLIIFMVAAPLATVDVPVELPTSPVDGSNALRPPDPLFITILDDGRMYLQNDLYPLEVMLGEVDRRTGKNYETRIYIRSDGASAYRNVQKVLIQLQDRGYFKVGLVALEE